MTQLLSNCHWPLIHFSIYYHKISHWVTKPPGMHARIIQCLSQEGKNCRLAVERAFGIKSGDDGGGGTNSADKVAFRWTVGASASVMFPYTTKCRRWRAVTEEVDKGCSNEFCVTVGTATSTASILIHSWLKALAVNLHRPSSRLVVYWLNWL